MSIIEKLENAVATCERKIDACSDDILEWEDVRDVLVAAREKFERLADKAARVVGPKRRPDLN